MAYEDRLEFALEASGTGLFTHPAHGDAVTIDHRLAAMLGRDQAGDIPLDAFLLAFHAEDRDQIGRALTDLRAGETRDRDLEVRVVGGDGPTERWLALRARLFGGEIVGTARDISESRLHDQQVHMLMREVTHRSKNLLAIIQAMARQTVKDSLTAADFEVRFSSRLRGLSFSHEILAAQDWRGAALEDLARGHLGPVLEQHKNRVHIGGPPVFLRPEAAQNIGLALNELTSNALKFGALSGGKGDVSLEWFVDADGSENRRLHVVWNEYGGTAVEPPLRQGFGRKVMERVVARALDGVVSLTFAPSGLQWSLRIPEWYMVTDAATRSSV